jgi:hypothetical protein
MLGLNQWLAGLLRAVNALATGNTTTATVTITATATTTATTTVAGCADVARELHAAAAALDRAIAIRGASETGPWRHWYRGDTKMNLPALASQTRLLADAFTRKHQPVPVVIP